MAKEPMASICCGENFSELDWRITRISIAKTAVSHFVSRLILMGNEMNSFALSPRPTRLSEDGLSTALASRGLGADRMALGLAGVGGGWRAVDEGESLATIEQALEYGIRVFDAAPAYVAAEKLLGRALAQWRGPRPIISTKVGRLSARDAHDARYDFSPEGLRDSVQRSLDIIGVSQIDLLFLHEPQLVPPAERPRVVAALRQIQADGLANRLGLAGGYGEGWDGLVETGAFDVAMLFRRIDPVIFDGLQDDLPRLRRAGMLTYGASPLHMGLLGARYEEFVRERPEWVWGSQIERAIRLRSLAQTNALSLSSLAHRFMFGLAELDRVVIGASNLIELNLTLADFEAGPLPPGLFDDVCTASFPS